MIEFTLFAERTPDAKRDLCRAIVRNLGELGVPAEDIKIVLLEGTSRELGHTRWPGGVECRFGVGVTV